MIHAIINYVLISNSPLFIIASPHHNPTATATADRADLPPSPVRLLRPSIDKMSHIMWAGAGGLPNACIYYSGQAQEQEQGV